MNIPFVMSIIDYENVYTIVYILNKLILNFFFLIIINIKLFKLLYWLSIILIILPIFIKPFFLLKLGI